MRIAAEKRGAIAGDARDRRGEQPGKNPGRANRGGIRQRRTLYLPQAQAIAAGILALQDCFDVAQAPGSGNLCEQQRRQHVLGWQPANALIGLVPADRAVKHALGKLVYQLAKNSIPVRHGGDLIAGSTCRDIC